MYGDETMQHNTKGMTKLLSKQDFGGEEYVTKVSMRAGKLAQRLRALVTLVEDPGSSPRIHMTAHSCL